MSRIFALNFIFKHVKLGLCKFRRKLELNGFMTFLRVFISDNTQNFNSLKIEVMNEKKIFFAMLQFKS